MWKLKKDSQSDLIFLVWMLYLNDIFLKDIILTIKVLCLGRMFEIGFHENIEQIVLHSSLNKNDIQILMFSATLSDEDVKKISKKSMTNYIFLAVGVVGSASYDVNQKFVEVKKRDKRG